VPTPYPSHNSGATAPPGATPPIVWLRIALGAEIPKPALGLFFDVLATLLHTGMSHPEAILRASEHVDPELRHICRTIAPKLRNGAALSEALRPYNMRFPAVVIPILAVGDVSGTLEHSSQRLASTFQGSVSIERRMQGKVFNPWAAILIFLLFRSYALMSAAKLPVMGIVCELLWNLIFCVVIYLGGRVLWRQLARWRPLRLTVDTLAISLPNIGVTLRHLAAARWARSFATLWRAGIPVSKALEISARTASNAYYESAFMESARQTRQGRSLTQTLKATQLLPSNLLSVIETGEESGHVAEGLENLAKIMEDEAFTRALKAMNGAVTGAYILMMFVMALAALSALN